MVSRLIHEPVVLPDQVLPRPADRLAIGVPGRVTFITSATGYGKSTLLAQWAKTYPHSIAWFSPVAALQPEEVVAAIRNAIRIAVGLPAMPSGPAESIDPLALAHEVRGLIEDYGRPLALVMDGPEFLRGEVEQLQDALRLLVERQPSNVAIVMVSRNFAFSGAEVAQLRGHLDRIDESHLRISDDVVAEALGANGVPAENIPELTAFIGGWPAALRIALSVVDQHTSLTSLRDQVRELGSARFFANALIDRVTPELREALIVTAIFEKVSILIAQAMGLEEAQVKSLSTAYEQGIPLSRRDHLGEFVIHPMFRDELLERLRRERPAEEVRLRIRAAEVYLAQEQYSEAIEQLIAAGEKQLALETLQSHYTKLLESGLGVRMRQWFEATSDTDAPRAERLRQRVYSAIIDGQIGQAESLLDSYEREADLSELKSACFLFLNKAWVAQARGDLEAMRTFAHAALDVLKNSESSDPRFGEYLDAANDYIAQAAIITEQPSEQDPRIARILSPEGRAPRPSLWLEVHHPALQAHLAVYRGEWRKALNTGERAIAATPQDLAGSVLFPWPALVAVAGAHREMGDAQTTIDLVDQHLVALTERPILVYAIDLLAVRAHALVDLGRISEGSETFARARSMVDTYGRGWWPFDRLDIHEARFVLRLGDVARAWQIAERIHESASAQVLRLRLDATRAPRRAQSLLNQLRRTSPVEEQNYRLFSAIVSPENSVEREEHLRLMLTIAQEHGSFRSIFDAGDPVVEMVTAYLLRHPSRYGETLLAKYRTQSALAASSKDRVSLSAREHQILGLLASQMTLQQIARTLFVSQNTLKTHLRNLYRKMQVSDRGSAVDKGRQLLLIN